MTTADPGVRADGAAAQRETAPAYGFPVVRRGYERAAVDAFASGAHSEISELRRRYETLAAPDPPQPEHTEQEHPEQDVRRAG